MDILYLQNTIDFYKHFDKFIWIARDPRDSYLSAIESGYAYLFWRRGQLENGIDIGLLKRWKRVYQHYFSHQESWYFLRYEDLVTKPDPTLRKLLAYLELPYEKLYPFSRFSMINGGDYKIRNSSNMLSSSLGRYKKQLTSPQREIFDWHIGEEMTMLGYALNWEPVLQKLPAASGSGIG